MDINGKKTAESSDQTEVDQQAADSTSTTATQTSDLAAQLDAALAEKAQLQDLVLRRQADYDNFRRRVEREKLDIRETASMDAAMALLPILDDFERALKALPAELEDGAFRDYAKGMDLIYQRLLDSLTRLGLEPVEAVGQPFDPNVHNGIQREERDDVEDHTVLEEYQRGYRFKGRLLRPAMVKVAVRP